MEQKYKNKIYELAELFKGYYIYPSGSYPGSFLEHFLHTHPDNHFSKNITTFLSIHNYQQDRIGADLPWWGEKYFSEDAGKRVFIISQDSNSDDAGSVTFYANLMQLMNERLYKDYVIGFQKFNGWKMTKELFELCGINLDFTYITDARKIYPIESIKYKNDGCETNEIMDYKRKMRRKLLCNKINNYINKELLLKEMKYCKPDLILILGNTGLELLDSKEKLTTILEGNCCITIEGTEYCVAPFPSGANGIYQKYKDKSANNIKNRILI